MLAGTIWRFWWNRGYTEEAGHWYERAFAVGDNASVTARARGLFGAAHVSESRGNSEQTRIRMSEAVDLFRQAGDERWLVLALTHLALAHGSLGDRDECQRLNHEALALAEAAGDVRGAAVVKANMAYHRLTWGAEPDDVRPLFEEALAGERAIGDTYSVATSLMNLAQLDLRGRDVDTASERLRESLELSRSLGDTHTLVHTLAVAAAAVLARGDAGTCARLCAADEALCEAHGFGLDEIERELLEETSRATRALLGATAAADWAAGSELDLEQALDLALGALAA
jgi:tetratricopeptide (TPR) repeat protein